MRLLRVTLIGAFIALLSSGTGALRPYLLRHKFERDVDHQSGGITVSDTRFYTGTDTGTMEERSLDGVILDVRNQYTTSSGTFTFNNETNRLGHFSQLAHNVANDVFYFCSEDDNAVYRYATSTNVMTRMAGDGTAGLQAGTGISAQIDCGNNGVESARDDARTKVYMASGRAGASTFAIVSITVNAATGADAGVLAIVSGSGTEGHVNGAAASARLRPVHGMFYYIEGANDYLVLGCSDDQGPIRYVNLTTGELFSSKVVFSATEQRTGVDAQARLANVWGIARIPGQRFGYGITSEAKAFTLVWTQALRSFKVIIDGAVVNGKWGTAVRPDGQRVYFGNVIPGDGTVARFEVKVPTITKSPPPTRTHTATISLIPTPKPPTTPAPPAPLTTISDFGNKSAVDGAFGSSPLVAFVCAVAAVVASAL